MRSIRIPYFRIWYSGAFSILFLITFLLTLICPTDLVYQSIRNHWLPNAFSLSGVYVLTCLVCIFVWASRIYTNRAVLREIPHPFVAVEHGEVPRKVRRMIEKQWARSALVAWDSRPRDVQEEMRAQEEMEGEYSKKKGLEAMFHKREGHGKGTTVIPLKTALKAWGHISHPGWSMPTTTTENGQKQQQSVQYWTVIVELPHLLEAKAVSLAPPELDFPADEYDSDMPPPADPKVVALLQRPSGMGLRDYLALLSSLNVIDPPSLAEDFVSQYEYARFSTRPLTEEQFDTLMATFASLLSAMVLDPADAEALVSRDGESISNDGLSSSSSISSIRIPPRMQHMHSATSLQSSASVQRRSRSGHSPTASFRSLSSVIINPQGHS
jgi:hypothetical protein